MLLLLLIEGTPTLADHVNGADGYMWIEPPFVPVSLDILQGCTTNPNQVQNSRDAIVVVSLPCEGCGEQDTPRMGFKMSSPQAPYMYEALSGAIANRRQVQVYFFSPEYPSGLEYVDFRVLNGTKNKCTMMKNSLIAIHGVRVHTS